MTDRLSGYVAGGDAKFAAWMRKVDLAVAKRTGLSVMDLPDLDFASLFEDGVSPSRAAAKAIREAGGM